MYFVGSNRTYGKQINLGQTIRFIAGLVSQEHAVEEEIKSMSESRRVKHSLSLAVVIHAALIKDAIELLPLSVGD